MDKYCSALALLKLEFLLGRKIENQATNHLSPGGWGHEELNTETMKELPLFWQGTSGRLVWADDQGGQ